jgi:WS/DGAT/MGAT family acyltransferase
MRRMQGLDGAFLSLESPTTHLHIAGVLLFDATGAPAGVSFRRIREAIAERVHLVAPFRQRLCTVPFGLQHPSLVDDPDFDLDYHVRRVSVPHPGGPNELAAVVGDLVGRPLDRQRPLWEFTVVEGLEHEHVAMVTKVHHAIIDGVSGAEILANFFDLSEVGRPIAAPEVWAPDPVPGEIEQIRSVVGGLANQGEMAAQTVGRTVQSMRRLARRNRSIPATLPPSPFDAPRTSINRAISPHRRVAFTEVPLAEVKRVSDVLGGTINDVVLAMVAGTLRDFFDGRDEELSSSLVAMVPVSVRADKDREALGNQVSAMLVSLATSVENPAARLRLISDGAARSKEQHDVVGADVFAGWAQSLTPAIATRASRLLSNLRAFDHLPPMFNTIVSNIPGPDFPLYLAGSRLVAMYPLGPVIEGVGVNVTVFSYAGAMSFGINACWDLVPDVDVLARGIRDALDALLKEADRRDRPVPWWHEDESS